MLRAISTTLSRFAGLMRWRIWPPYARVNRVHNFRAAGARLNLLMTISELKNDKYFPQI